MADGESTSTVSEQVWAVTLPVEPASGQLGGSGNLSVDLPLPPGPYESRLADRPPRYWELEVHGEAKGVDFGPTFLLRVYAPSGVGASGQGRPT